VDLPETTIENGGEVTMKRRLTTMFCLWFLQAPMIQAQQEELLDLTRIKVTKKERQGPLSGSGMMGFAGHDRTPKIIPLKITLLSLDRPSYRLGETVVFEVRVENITQEIVVLPWSPDIDAVKPDEESDPPGYMDAYLTLVVRVDISGDQTVIGQPLYGSELEPGSLKPLWPGETVRIRVPGRWYLPELKEKLPHSFEVRADLGFLRGIDRERYEWQVQSTNTLKVELRR
jgi:hypothetical protein